MNYKKHIHIFTDLNYDASIHIQYQPHQRNELKKEKRKYIKIVIKKTTIKLTF